MIEGEIKVGERFQESGRCGTIRVDPDGCVIFRYEYEPHQNDPTFRRDQSDHDSSWIDFRRKFERIPVTRGWTPISPETLPGDEVDRVFVGQGNDLDIVVIDEQGDGDGWKYLLDRTWDAWRPIPPEWLPLPTSPSEPAAEPPSRA